MGTAQKNAEIMRPKYRTTQITQNIVEKLFHVKIKSQHLNYILISAEMAYPIAITVFREHVWK